MTVTESHPRPAVVDGVPTLSPVEAGTDDEQRDVREPRTSRVVLKRVDPWSVLKLSLVFYLCVCLVLLVAGILLWTVASAAGVVGNIESFFRDAGFDGFEFSAGPLLRGFALIGVILVVAGTVANMLLAALFNILGEVFGGLRVTLVEDVERTRR